MLHESQVATGDNLGDGERLKAEAHRLLREHRRQLIHAGEQALLKKILQEGSATLDDVRAEVACPPGIDPRVFGAVPGPLAKCGAIRALGFSKTRRAIAHARMLVRWGLGDLSQALATLADTDPPAVG